MAATNTITNLGAQVAQANDIRDIRPLVEIPNHWIWLGAFLGALTLAVLATWVWIRLRQRAAAAPPAPLVPAHVRARQRLEAALNLIRDPKPFIIAVSDALRVYLEEAFELRAPEQTTEEFLIQLQHSALLSEAQKTSLGDFLQSCDMVKFARYEPRENELRELHAYALELVAQTEPATELSHDKSEPGDGPDPRPTLDPSPIPNPASSIQHRASSIEHHK